jgi:hypothetical protein
LALERLDFLRSTILAASHAAVSMVVHLEADGLEARFWPTSGLPTVHKLACFVKTRAFLVPLRL